MPADIDAMLVTKLVNVRYLTGFTGSSGAVLVRRDGDAVLATDGRYDEQARAEAPELPIVVSRTPAAELVATARNRDPSRLGIEWTHVTLASFDALRDAAGDVDLVAAPGSVEQLRECKDEDEIAALRTACAVTDHAFSVGMDLLRPGLTERELAWALVSAMRAAGAQDAFDSIVAFGENSSMPHHQPTARSLRHGDLVKVDFGALVDGYHADMTRTVVFGSAQDWQRELHAQVAAVAQSCRAAAVAGAVPVELDAFARDQIAACGHPSAHGLGHGVGLEIHESPLLVPGSGAAPLRPGCTVTIEPGIYLPGRGGVRIEDVLLITDGAPELLTSTARDLVEV